MNVMNINSTFSLKGSLSTHAGIHPGLRHFQCNVCDSAFSDNTSLRRHLRIHTGEKPFKCEVCFSSISLKCYQKEKHEKTYWRKTI